MHATRRGSAGTRRAGPPSRSRRGRSPSCTRGRRTCRRILPGRRLGGYADGLHPVRHHAPADQVREIPASRAHRRRLGIVHRDVSPQNVMVSFDGEVKLIDFGIAKAESRLQKTQAGILKGKFSYMSPEQVKGQPIDGRSDIFAAGILLWELVCGEKLFTGDSDFAILEKVRNDIVPAPRSVTRTVPEGLEKVILKALSNDPNQRYQAASELHDDLMRFTFLGDMVYGHRQLAEWIREEFAQDWEKEQARLRGWLEVGEEKSDVTPSDPRRKLPRMVAQD